MAQIAVLIKTFLREEALLNCVASVRRHFGEGGYRIYVADDGAVGPGKHAEYERLRGEGHVVLELPEGTGASASRNALLARLGDERFVLRMDDDYELTAETDLGGMRRILEAEPWLGAVADLERQIGHGKGAFSGQISDGQGLLLRRDGTLVKKLVPLHRFEYRTVHGVRFAECGFSRNMLLIRREVFDEIRWEEALPFAGEHADFLLQLQQSRWGLAFTPDSIHLHRDDLGASANPAYNEVKRRQEQMWRVYRAKWNVTRITVQYPLRGMLRRAALRLIR